MNVHHHVLLHLQSVFLLPSYKIVAKVFIAISNLFDIAFRFSIEGCCSLCWSLEPSVFLWMLHHGLWCNNEVVEWDMWGEGAFCTLKCELWVIEGYNGVVNLCCLINLDSELCNYEVVKPFPSFSLAFHFVVVVVSS